MDHMSSTATQPIDILGTAPDDALVARSLLSLASAGLITHPTGEEAFMLSDRAKLDVAGSLVAAISAVSTPLLVAGAATTVLSLAAWHL